MTKCVLVFGVPGVGKSTACRAYVIRHPNTLFVSASTLLKIAHRTTTEGLRAARAHKIIENQGLLGEALSLYRTGRETMSLLVDAHGVIDNDRELVRVPISAVRQLEPDLLVLLQATPAQVAARRAQDVRPRPTRSIEAIAREMQAEYETVRSYATELGLDLLIGDVDNGFRLDALLEPALAVLSEG